FHTPHLAALEAQLAELTGASRDRMFVRADAEHDGQVHLPGPGGSHGPIVQLLGDDAFEVTGPRGYVSLSTATPADKREYKLRRVLGLPVPRALRERFGKPKKDDAALSQDAAGNEHRGKGPGGGQFVGPGDGGDDESRLGSLLAHVHKVPHALAT